MTRYVVDASVAVKWLVPEEYADIAAALIEPFCQLVGPEFLAIEVANVGVQKYRRNELTLDEALQFGEKIRNFPVSFVKDIDLVADAARLATGYGRAIYDCLYVALAVREQCRLITADRRLYNALSPSHEDVLLWIADLPLAADAEIEP